MKKVYFMLLGVLLSTAVMADNKQTVTIDGSQVGKTVKGITFDGDNVTLTFDDETTETKDMSLVKLSFAYSTTGISNIETRFSQARCSILMVSLWVLLPRT